MIDILLMVVIGGMGTMYGAVIDLLSHERRQVPTRQMALQVMPAVAVSSATTLVDPTTPCLR